MTEHEHLWTTDSSHPTSEGMVVYQRCHCGEHRVALTPPVLQAHTTAPERHGR
ncbi:hypothetical protein [Nocardiopsis sp. NPDC058789]|uniref:Uncharacterized protein n=1 Tax=Nocardiopsis eucommiae TaxID=2831970 RepID=A0A975L729_9ACTN|nr:hypothetical protein KGD82_14850 [Nocardiopsis eucommiae]